MPRILIVDLHADSARNAGRISSIIDTSVPPPDGDH
jgi:hypothetical protein